MPLTPRGSSGRSRPADRHTSPGRCKARESPHPAGCGWNSHRDGSERPTAARANRMLVTYARDQSRGADRQKPVRSRQADYGGGEGDRPACDATACIRQFRGGTGKARGECAAREGQGQRDSLSPPAPRTFRPAVRAGTGLSRRRFWPAHRMPFSRAINAGISHSGIMFGPSLGA